MEGDFDVLCVGHACYDIVLRVGAHPQPDEKVSAAELVLCGGGPAANAAVAISRLGGRALLLAYLGEDLFGALHLEELVSEGVGSTLIVRGSFPTPLAVVLVKPQGSRTVINYSGGTPKLEKVPDPFSFGRPRVILLDGHEPIVSMEVVKKAKEFSIPTVLDAGSLHPGTELLAPRVQYVVASWAYARAKTTTEDPLEALEALATLYPCVVITRGEEGLLWAREGKRGKEEAFPVHCVDSTGAGDAFHGAFALGLAQGMPWEELLRFASAAGALACTKLGARKALPRKEELEDFLKKRS
jgi:sulfofructose kinase